MPAASSSSTSCQRLAWREPGRVGVGQLVDQQQRGLPHEAASRSNSSSTRPRYSSGGGGRRLEPPSRRRGLGAAVGLDHADHDSRPAARCARAASSIAKVLPTPGATPKKILSWPRRARSSSAWTRRSSSSGSGRESVMSLKIRGGGAVRQSMLSSAMLSRSTLTRGSPKNPNCRPSVCASSSSRDRARGRRRAHAPRAPPAARRWRARCADRAPTPTRSTMSDGTCPRRPVLLRPRASTAPAISVSASLRSVGPLLVPADAVAS